MAFEPGDEYRTAVDSDTGARMKIGNAGSQMEFLIATYSCLGAQNITFSIELKSGRSGSNAIIYATDIERIFRAAGQSDHEKNTALVRQLVNAVVTIDRKWPLMRNTRLGSNYDEYSRKGKTFSFSMPSDNDLGAGTT